MKKIIFCFCLSLFFTLPLFSMKRTRSGQSKSAPKLKRVCVSKEPNIRLAITRVLVDDYAYKTKQAKRIAIQELIAQGHAGQGTGETLSPLYWATILGYEDIMIALLKAGANPSYKPFSIFETPTILQLAQQKKLHRFIALVQAAENKKN